jgi:hypothetical protein
MVLTKVVHVYVIEICGSNQVLSSRSIFTWIVTLLLGPMCFILSSLWWVPPMSTSSCGGYKT